jgi:5-methylcytosine-specific restriction endonuclease McrA
VTIFYRAGGLCHICGEKIGLAERWEIEHRIPLALGGDEAKGSLNLQPAHARCHSAKTSVDAWNNAKAKRREAKHIGAAVSQQPLPGGRGSPWKKKLNGKVVPR